MGDIKAIEPTATTNLCTQPSFEVDIDLWSTAGSNTIAKSSAQSYKGNYSLLCTYGDELSLASYDVTLPTISVTYKLTARLYVSANWDGGNISLSSVDYAGATNTVVSQYTHGTSAPATWLKLETTLSLSTDAIGSVSLAASSAPTAGRFVYLDAVQVEKQSTATTYTDGDQPGGVWDGEPHNSTSTRDARAWQGGIIRDLHDDYSFKVFQYPGAGLTTMSNNYQEYAMLKGAFFQNTKRHARQWALLGAVIGTTFAGLHTARKGLVNLLNPSRYGGSDPVVLRYTGATTEKDIVAYYEDGLGWDNPEYVNEKTPIRLLSPDPDFYGDRDNSTALDVFASDTFRLVAGKINGAWSSLGPPNVAGTYTNIYDIAYFNDENIYFAGTFENFDNIAAADRIVKYNLVTATWASITPSGAPNGAIRSLAVDPLGNLYAAGLFTSINGVAANYIAKYVPSTGTWSALSTGMNNFVYKLRWYEGLLYAVGEFTTAGGTTVNRVTSWNGSGFTAFGGGTKGVGTTAAYDIAIIQNEGLNDMYVVGDFTTAGGSAAAGVAKFTAATSTWSALSTGLTGGGATGLVATILPNGDLIIGGDFTAAGGVSATYIVRYNGKGFFPLGRGVNGPVYSLSYNKGSGILHIGGNFTTAGGSSIGDRVVDWNGSKYLPLDIDLPGTPDVYAIVDTGSDLYLGFSTTGTGYYSNPTTVNNAGTEPANPIIKITRSGGTLVRIETIENAATGKRIYLNRSLQDGETLVIDTRVNGRGVYSEFSGGIAGSEIQPAAVQPGSDLKTFTILTGDNTIQCYAATAGTPTVTAFCMFRDTFGSLDG